MVEIGIGRPDAVDGRSGPSGERQEQNPHPGILVEGRQIGADVLRHGDDQHQQLADQTQVPPDSRHGRPIVSAIATNTNVSTNCISRSSSNLLPDLGH